MSEEKTKTVGNVFMVVGALMLVTAFFDQLKDLHSWAELVNPHTLGEFGSRYGGAAVGIIGAYFGGSDKDREFYVGLGRR